MIPKLRKSGLRESSLESELLASTASSNIFHSRRAVSSSRRAHSDSEDDFSSHSSEVFSDSPMRLHEIEEDKLNFADLKSKIQNELKELRSIVEKLDSSEKSFENKSSPKLVKRSASQRRTQSDLTKLALFENELRQKKEQQELCVQKLMAAERENYKILYKIQSIEEIKNRLRKEKACCECALF